MIWLSAGSSFLWRQLDDVYIVYQPSSTETHLFNETTALILQSLENGPLTTAVAKNRTEAALGVDQGELDIDEFAFAVGRLEELGLVDSLEQTLATQ